ncbi:RNA polymerase-binding protein DksA (plasmid) [Streptomyces sp. NBC_01298]|uniref:RNA polymerase-binding protein DksA n=1 Tax=Streptomyces sp. NBC_01298 TaxID=2903817 RepID=UPI002E10C66B|nr:RNA polymerase-binding protein DksA [Streptomyces sp. NBC_01298]
MSESMLTYFMKRLDSMKQELLHNADATTNNLREVAANAVDPADRARREEELALELATRDRERRLLKKVDSALLRIQHGKYGWCETCEGEIGLRRLQTRPTQELCVDCREVAEEKVTKFGA